MSNQKPVVPDFLDTPAAAKEAADRLLSGFDNSPLTVPASATTKKSKGVTYTRFAESVSITHAYRTVTSTGLLDIVVGTLVRQSEDNNGRRVFFHFYQNTGLDIPEGHVSMNERSDAALLTLLSATGLMPTSGNVTGQFKRVLFPEKDTPGSRSALVGKSVVVNITQTTKQAKDKDTKQVMFDAEGQPEMEIRDQAEAFLPEEVAVETETVVEN